MPMIAVMARRLPSLLLPFMPVTGIDSRKPRLAGGIGGRIEKEHFLTGKPPLGGELLILFAVHFIKFFIGLSNKI